MLTFDFPVGYHDLHSIKIIDFQLNRWHSLGYARLEDVRSAGRQIQTFDDWKRVMTALAKKAASEERWINAAFYYRAAEFFVLPSDPDKETLYDLFVDTFYNQAVAGEPIERHWVPYGGSNLPALRIPAGPGKVKGVDCESTGAFDSFIEEWYSCAAFFVSERIRRGPVRGPWSGSSTEKVRPAADARVGKAGRCGP